MLTPKDIETKIFKISFRGYDVSEVDDFLQEICDSYVEIYDETKKYLKQIKNLSETVEQYKAMEDTVCNAVTVADKSATEIEAEARQKADDIVKNAKITAESIVAGAKQKTENEENRFNMIKREVEIYKTKIIDLLNAQLSVLKEYPQSGDFKSDLGVEHKQQLWMKVQNEPRKEAENHDEKSKADTRDTVPVSTVTDKADCDEEVKKTTQELPRVSVNDDGEYVVRDR